MKKLLVILTILCFVLSYSMAFAQRRSPPESRNIVPASSCTWLTFYGVLCHDTDDGKIYKWNGATQVELAAGGAGDMTLAQFDTDLDGFIDANNGGTDIDTSALTGTPQIAAGVWSVANAATMKTNLGLVIGTNVQAWDADLDYLATFTPTANVKSILNAADYVAIKTLLALTIGTNVQAWDADLDYLATFTPTANVKSILNAADYAAIKALLDLEIGTDIPPINNPTFTGVVTFPNNGLHILDTDASHDLIITPGSNLSADRILTITTGDSARTLTLDGNATLDQDVSADANPSFSTLNLVGANALNVGSSRTIDGTVRFKSGTALNDFYHEIRGANFAANTLWILPTAVPGGSNYLLNVDADGTMGYTSPVVTNFTGGNWKLFYTNGTGVLTELALGTLGYVLTSAGPAAAPYFDAPSAVGDISDVWNCASGDCTDLTAGAADIFNASSAASSRPFKSGLDGSLPGTCSEPMTYWATDTNKLYICTATNTWLELSAIISVDDLITLSGVAGGAVNLGTFTGAIITDNITIKAALQEVETAIEGLGGGHAAVTLGATATPILGLTTQEISFDTQTANYILAGPESAGPTAPTFRALVDADIPAAIARDAELPTASTLHVDDLIALSGVAQGAVSLGTFTGVTIPDTQTIKQALQALETAYEAGPGVTAGTLIDIVAGVVSVDTTESDNLTWGASGGGSQVWTWDTGVVTDPTLTISDTLFLFNKTIEATGFTATRTDNPQSITLYEATSDGNNYAQISVPALGVGLTANRAITVPDHAFTMDNITTATTTNLTGLIKGASGNMTAVLPPWEMDIHIAAPAATDVVRFRTPRAITLTSIGCIVDPANTGESVVVDLQECDANADNCVTVLSSTITCGNTNTTGTFADTSLAANVYMLVDLGTVTGTVSDLTIYIRGEQSW